MTSHVSSISESLDLCMPVSEQFGANMIHVCTYGCLVRNPLNLKCHSGMAFWPRRSDWVILLSRISCCVVCSYGAETDTECYRRSPLNALLHSFTECRALFSRGRLGTLTFWPRLGKACSARSNFASDDWLSYNRLQFRTGPVREPILISLLLSHLNELRGLEPNLPLGLDWILWQPRE